MLVRPLLRVPENRIVPYLLFHTWAYVGGDAPSGEAGAKRHSLPMGISSCERISNMLSKVHMQLAKLGVSAA